MNNAAAQSIAKERSILQVAAMLTMLVDHIGYVYFPGELGWRLIGRLSFPLYAYALVQGYLHTSHAGKYLRRLGWLALVSQIPFMLAIHPFKINVIGTLLLCAIVLSLLDKIKHIYLQIPAVTLAALVMDWIPMDYGAYALFLIVAYRYSPAKWWIGWHILITLFYMLKGMPVYQLLSVIATAWLMISGVNNVKLPWTVPRWLWLGFYPAHLLLLFIFKAYW